MAMNDNEFKKYISSIKSNQRKLEKLKLDLAEINNYLLGYKGINYSSIPSGKSFKNNIATLLDKKDKILFEIISIQKFLSDFYQKFKQLDERSKSIIRLYYFENKTNVTISKILSLSRLWTIKLRKESIKKF